MPEPTLLSFRCHIQGRTIINFCPTIDKLSTLGQDDVIIQWSSLDLTNRIKQIQIPQIPQISNQSTQYTCMVYQYTESKYFLGTSSGKIIQIKPNNSGYSAQIIYDMGSHITTLSLSNNNSYLSVGSYSNISSAIIPTNVLNEGKINKQNILTPDKGHDGAVLALIFSFDQKYFGTIGNDGFAIFYRIQAQTLKYCGKFKVITHNQQSDQTILKQAISQNPQNQGHFVLSGNTILQQIWLSNQSPQYQLKTQIQQKQPILSLAWINSICLSLVMNSYVSIWNYGKTQNIVRLNNLADVMEIAADNRGLFCTKMDGVVYRYQGYETFDKITKQSKEQYAQIQIQQEKQQNNESQQQKRIIKQQPKLSVAAQLIKIYPQRAIQTSYEGYMQNRFLYYNQYGCIIERTDGDSLLIELQYHDKQKIHRIKFESKNKLICYFAIHENCFAYSTLKHFYFQRQVQLTSSDPNSHKRQYLTQKWDYRWDGIQGIAISTNWVAIASKLQIKIFDLSGNQLYSICYQKDFLCMSTYEDILVLVYHASLPIYTTQLYQMKVYTITLDKCKYQQRLKVPVKDNQTIKWFGFSEEGILFMQQTSEDIRMYNWISKQWLNVLEGNISQCKVYIQHIQNYEIFGFSIEQRQGQPNCPTVQPRSIPKRIRLKPYLQRIQFLTEQQNDRANILYLRKIMQQLETFRIKRWYKLKYSRNHNHPCYGKINKIMTTEQLEVLTGHHDIQIVQYTKKLLKLLESNKPQGRTNYNIQEAKKKLLYLTSYLINYESTLKKLKQVLNTQTNHSQALMQQIQILRNYSENVKYNQIDRIVKMVDMGWCQQQ